MTSQQMTSYKAPQREFLFLLKELIGYEQHVQQLGLSDADLDSVTAILPEAARFFEEVIAPTNQPSDEQGTSLGSEGIIPAPALDNIYQQLTAGGWCALSGKPEYGGAGFPLVAGLMLQEMLQSSNLAFSLMPMLTSGVVHALALYASNEQKATYLHHLVTGHWAGTMNLTEPQAGTDLGAIKTKAVANGDHYLISGQKIFITWGDQPYTDNIVHLVLARTADAPEGTQGISMFIVPKYLINADGSIGERNDAKPVGVEHKLGIHASPTCTMQYGDNGGAVGYLVGQENKGLIYMFSMMNAARLAVGHQGVAVSERSYQQALRYAKDRVQGQLHSDNADGGSPAGIFYHPDVRRMLMHMKAITEAGRALSFIAIEAEDIATHHDSAEVRAAHSVRVDVLTPLVKAWCTDSSVEVSSLGVQVHGGMGFIEETGAAQHYRDARILPIYEGTNGIQALDFIGRKTLKDQGAGLMALLADCEKTLADLAAYSNAENSKRAQMAAALTSALLACQQALKLIAAKPDEAMAVAYPFMMLFANTVCGWLMVRSGAIALQNMEEGSDDTFYKQKLATAEYFIHCILPRNSGYLAQIKAGSTTYMALSVADFER